MKQRIPAAWHNALQTGGQVGSRPLRSVEIQAWPNHFHAEHGDRRQLSRRGQCDARGAAEMNAADGFCL